MVFELRIARFGLVLMFLMAFGCSNESSEVEVGHANELLEHTGVAQDDQIENPWYTAGKQTVQQRKALALNKNQAKNVILFIGDGMGVSTVTAARIFDGQSKGGLGEENVLPFERFPHVALIKTYNIDAQVPDSAGTASAMNTGVKTRFLSIGIWGDQPADDCFGPQINFPRTLAEIGETIGMSTGIVTTDKVTYATPAAVYAHSPSRAWEDDSRLPEEARQHGCQDIAQQLVQFPYGDGLDVVMGGGTESMLPVDQGGQRLDNRNLIKDWQQRFPSGQVAQSAKELRALDSEENRTEKLLGLFAPGHLSYAADKNLDVEPSLSEMTSIAIDRLSKNPKGYFLMVENGHIDHANHDTNAYRTLTDVQAFSQAVETALAKVNLEETLILVTADHSHALTIMGYPKRGNPILGRVKPVGGKGGANTQDGFTVDDQGVPFTTLGYRAGPNHGNVLAENENTEAMDYKQSSAVQLPSGTHSGEDVALYAIGPKSHLVGGVLEQNVIFHIMTEALGWND